MLASACFLVLPWDNGDMNANVMFAWVLALAAGPALAEIAPRTPSDFGRYGIILERKPFGEEWVPPPVAAPVVPPEQSFTTQIKMTAVTRDDQGVLRVGLVDLKDKRGMMVGVGDMFNGVTVVAADFTAERARLQRDPEDYWVSMSAGGTNRFEVTAGPAPAAEAAPAPSLATETAPARMADQQRSYAVRRLNREEARLRREIERLRAAEARQDAGAGKTGTTQAVASVRAGAKASPVADDAGQKLLALLGQSDKLELSPEELNQLIQEYQKDLIRSGQTPLPIPLTPETDRQLVEEGVLPAPE